MDVQGGAADAEGGALDARVLETSYETQEKEHRDGEHAQEPDDRGDRPSQQRGCGMAAALHRENDVVVCASDRQRTIGSETRAWRLEKLTWRIRCRCSSLGVQEIVLHDPRGQLKKHMNTFVDHILELAEVIDPIVGCVRCRYSFPAKNGSKAKCILPGGRNYVEDKFELRTGITREALRLHIICEKDSYLSLLEAACLPASELVPLAQNGSGNAAETNGAEMLTARGLDQQLRALGSYLPDPQLVMVLGEDTNLAGYPPWNIQVSEIYCLGPATRISKKHIARVVHLYFSTMQRFGK